MKTATKLSMPLLLLAPIGMSLDAASAQDKDYSEQTDTAAPEGDLARPPAWQVQLIASTEEKSAKLSLDLFRLKTVFSGNNSSSYASDQALNLSVSTPWDKENDALPASLDGLAGGTKISLDYSIFGSRRIAGVTNVQQALADKAIAKCLANGGRKIGATPSDVSKKCSDENDWAQLVKAYLSDRDNRSYTNESFEGGLHAFGISASVGFDKFKFADSAQLATGTIAELSTRETSWSAGLRYAYYLPSTPTAIGLNVDYESAWKGADAATLCPAAVGMAVTQCTSLAPAEPTRSKSTKLSANIRHRFLFGDDLSNFAISPRVTYAFTQGEKDVWGIELPIYFIPNGTGGLNGGVKAGYRSDNRDITFGVFLGAAFGLFQ